MRYSSMITAIVLFLVSVQTSNAHGGQHIHPHGFGEMLTIIALGSVLTIAAAILVRAHAKKKRGRK